MINGKLNEYYSLRGKIKSPDEVEKEMQNLEKLIKDFFDRYSNFLSILF